METADNMRSTEMGCTFIDRESYQQKKRLQSKPPFWAVL